MILDGCTSSLVAGNQAIVLDTVMRLALLGGDSMDEADRKTTLTIMHKLEVMQMCDRVLAVDQGEIVVDGSFETAYGDEGSFCWDGSWWRMDWRVKRTTGLSFLFVFLFSGGGFRSFFFGCCFPFFHVFDLLLNTTYRYTRCLKGTGWLIPQARCLSICHTTCTWGCPILTYGRWLKIVRKMTKMCQNE